MSDKTHIEWTDSTWNPITGCTVVSAGCKNCYAMQLAGTRLKHHPSRSGLTHDSRVGPVWNGEVRFNTQWLTLPMAWKRPRRIFVCAHGDLFHEAIPDDWIDHVFAVMALSPHHTFQVLTKRSLRMQAYCSSNETAGRLAAMIASYLDGLGTLELQHQPDGFDGVMLPNVWLGVSVENQSCADERIPHLFQTPAAVRWISAEPLLEPVDLNLSNSSKKIDWVVVGGESGKRARPMHPQWARSLHSQCQLANVAFLFKQWGEWQETSPIGGGDLGGDMRADRARIVKHQGENNGHFSKGDVLMKRVGKKIAGRLLDGKIYDNFPDNPGASE